jgi:hypothetical protein
MAGLFDPLNPLQGLQNIPGANQLTGADNFVTSGQVTGFAQGAIPSLLRGDNPLLSIGLGGLGAIQGGQTAASNLANIAKTRQDLVKGGLDITEAGLGIQTKDFDLAMKKRNRAKLLETIYNMPPEQQALAESNPEAFTKMLIDQYKPTNSMVEYNLAKSEGYKGSYTDYVKEVEKYRATSFNMGGEGAYEKRLGEQLAEQDIEFVQTSKQLPFSVQKMDDTLSLIRNPKTRTGKLSGLVTNIDAIKQNFLNVDDSVKEGVGNTQLLDALLGSEVFPMIKALGIGARGLDTPAEREFLRQVMTGTIELNRDTLTKMTMIRRRQFQSIANEYNRQLKSGELSSYMKQKNLKPLELAAGKNSAFIATGTDNDLNRKFSIFSDGRAYYHNQDGSISDDEVVGFDWLKYNYD